jgi:hypothetical protein
MWLPVAGSVLLIGASWFVVYLVYLKMRHPDLILTARRSLPDFIQVWILLQNIFQISKYSKHFLRLKKLLYLYFPQDSFASLIQSEQPPMFRFKAKCSAGSIFIL